MYAFEKLQMYQLKYYKDSNSYILYLYIYIFIYAIRGTHNI